MYIQKDYERHSLIRNPNLVHQRLRLFSPLWLWSRLERNYLSVSSFRWSNSLILELVLMGVRDKIEWIPMKTGHFLCSTGNTIVPFSILD
jgi:hypothetical protein